MTRKSAVRFILLFFLFFGLLDGYVFAQTPKILKLSEVEFGTKAIGFSVFREVEPEKFDVQLRAVVDAGGFSMIVSHISGGPMETPLESIGAVAGMSGSPVFVGNCNVLDECVRKAPLPGNDVFLVGALGYSIGFFAEGGPNAGLTPAEYMLGARLGGYSAAGQFSIRPPNKIIVDGLEFHNLMLAPDISGASLQGGAEDYCDTSIKSELGPGSMITIFLAKGSRNIGGSGTVTWRDGDRVYVFGHPFLGSGRINLPFSHVAVADTVQTPFGSYKIAGCQLETKGTMLVDGTYEVAGIIGQQARLLPFHLDLNVGGRSDSFFEEIAESPLVPMIIKELSILWAQGFLGDLSQVSVAFQTRIAVTNQPEIFLNSLLPAQAIENPFEEVFSRTGTVLEKLKDSGFSYNLESIKTQIHFVRGVNVWTEKRSFLSQNQVKPGETIHVNILLEERSSGAIRQISIPIKASEDFEDRLTPKILPQILVSAQSADKFEYRGYIKEIASLRDIISMINESAAQQQNVLYVQQVMPLTKVKRETAEKTAQSSILPDWSWVELDQGALRRLPENDNTEVLLTITPELNHFISFDRTFVIQVDVSDKSMVADGEVSEMTEEKKKRRRWYFFFLK